MKRDRLEIIHDILEVIRDRGPNVKSTHIMYKSNLSHKMLTDYLTELIEKEFILLQEDKKGKKIYRLSNKGYGYLKDYAAIRGFIDSYGLDV